MSSTQTKQPVFFSDFMGFDIAQAEHGQALVRYQPCPEHLNAFGVVHGGACMALMDMAMAAAVRSQQPTMRVATVQMNTQFFAPAQGALTARARCLHCTATLAFAEVTLHGADGKPCAKARGTFKLVRDLLPKNPRHQVTHTAAQPNT